MALSKKNKEVNMAILLDSPELITTPTRVFRRSPIFYSGHAKLYMCQLLNKNIADFPVFRITDKK